MVSHILIDRDVAVLDAMDGLEFPPEAELFAQLASQATEALLLSHRAVQIAEAKLAAREHAATRRSGHGIAPEVVVANPVDRFEPVHATAATPAQPRQRLRERFGLSA